MGKKKIETEIIESSSLPYYFKISKDNRHKCDRCWRPHDKSYWHGLCLRCANVLKSQGRKQSDFGIKWWEALFSHLNYWIFKRKSKEKESYEKRKCC